MEVREPSAKYLARAGYKQTEVGVIPEDWMNPQFFNLRPLIQPLWTVMAPKAARPCATQVASYSPFAIRE